jgi:hypothetical protein
MSIRSYLIGAAIVGTAIGASSIMMPRWLARQSATTEQRLQTEMSASYSGCREVRSAGKAPLLRGEPGYRTWMDGDDDGIACEDY